MPAEMFHVRICEYDSKSIDFSFNSQTRLLDSSVQSCWKFATSLKILNANTRVTIKPILSYYVVNCPLRDEFLLHS